MKELLLEMRILKNKYLALKSNPKKTKAAKEKRLDAMRLLRREFLVLTEKLDFTGFDIRALNLLAPSSGPWCLVDAENFKDEGNYFSFNFKDDTTRYVGEYSLLDDKCGIDNLKQLEKQAGLV